MDPIAISIAYKLFIDPHKQNANWFDLLGKSVGFFFIFAICALNHCGTSI